MDISTRMTETMHSYLKGYWKALSDYGIWKDGQRHIGCLEKDIKEAFTQKVIEMGHTKEDAQHFIDRY